MFYIDYLFSNYKFSLFIFIVVFLCFLTLILNYKKIIKKKGIFIFIAVIFVVAIVVGYMENKKVEAERIKRVEAERIKRVEAERINKIDEFKFYSHKVFIGDYGYFYYSSLYCQYINDKVKNDKNIQNIIMDYKHRDFALAYSGHYGIKGQYINAMRQQGFDNLVQSILALFQQYTNVSNSKEPDLSDYLYNNKVEKTYGVFTEEFSKLTGDNIFIEPTEKFMNEISPEIWYQYNTLYTEIVVSVILDCLGIK